MLLDALESELQLVFRWSFVNANKNFSNLFFPTFMHLFNVL